jgi:hypothetical protein
VEQVVVEMLTQLRFLMQVQELQILVVEAVRKDKMEWVTQEQVALVLS